jgi:hypothetical protein
MFFSKKKKREKPEKKKKKGLEEIPLTLLKDIRPWIIRTSLIQTECSTETMMVKIMYFLAGKFIAYRVFFYSALVFFSPT